MHLIVVKQASPDLPRNPEVTPSPGGTALTHLWLVGDMLELR